jgi:hypothetical protein
MNCMKILPPRAWTAAAIFAQAAICSGVSAVGVRAYPNPAAAGATPSVTITPADARCA